jgi:uncharacterized membrane protein YeaQ/YmgE (transglycosylase-associated protein family)
MTLGAILVLLIVAACCGSLGQAIAGYSHGGCFASCALGFIGALVGIFVARALKLPEIFALNIGGTSFPVVWSIMGSALFVAVLSLVQRGRRTV